MEIEEVPPQDIRDQCSKELLAQVYAELEAISKEECVTPENTVAVADGDYVSDADVFIAGKKIQRRSLCHYYDTDLCARLGLYCYNFQKGTTYDFWDMIRLYTRYGRYGDSFTKSFITLEALNRADRSRLTLETCVKRNDEDCLDGLSLWWETCICRPEGSQEADYDWDDEAIDVHYKGEMPKWPSDDDQKRCYVLQDSERLDRKNWWLQLFTEAAFYAKWNGTLQVSDIPQEKPLKICKVLVETRGEAEIQPCDKLKAANAIFYIIFRCAEDPETGELGYYRAVVRKTMDGKPGHMRLEVMCWSILEHLIDSAQEKGSEIIDFSIFLLS